MAASLTPNALHPKTSSLWLHLTANQTLTIVGNDSVSNVASVGQTITGVTIKQAIWSAANQTTGFWRIARGSNVYLTFGGTGNVNFAASGVSVSQDSNATLVVTLNNTTDGFLLLELKKLPESLANTY